MMNVLHTRNAAKRENQSKDSTWTQDRENVQDKIGQDSQKSHKGVIFHLLVKKPTLNRFALKFAQQLHPRHNHVCKVLN